MPYNLEEQGKEIIVKAFGDTVGLYRYTSPFQLRAIFIFSTASDCQGSFDWTGSRLSWPFYFKIPNTLAAEYTEVGFVVASLGDCAVFHEARFSDGTTLSPPFSYDVTTQTLTIQMKTTTTRGTKSIIVSAIIDDGVTTRNVAT